MITHLKHFISRSEGYLFSVISPLKTKLQYSDVIAQSNPPASESEPAFVFFQKGGSQQSNLTLAQLQIGVLMNTLLYRFQYGIPDWN